MIPDNARDARNSSRRLGENADADKHGKTKRCWPSAPDAPEFLRQPAKQQRADRTHHASVAMLSVTVVWLIHKLLPTSSGKVRMKKSVKSWKPPQKAAVNAQACDWSALVSAAKPRRLAPNTFRVGRAQDRYKRFIVGLRPSSGSPACMQYSASSSRSRNARNAWQSSQIDIATCSVVPVCLLISFVPQPPGDATNDLGLASAKALAGSADW